MQCDLHAGDYGTELRFWLTDAGVPVDVSLASTKNLFLKSPLPPYSVTTHAMSFITTGVDGGLKYVLQSGDVPATADGDWQAQVHIVLPGGSWKSTVITICVARNLA